MSAIKPEEMSIKTFLESNNDLSKKDHSKYYRVKFDIVPDQIKLLDSTHWNNNGKKEHLSQKECFDGSCRCPKLGYFKIEKTKISENVLNQLYKVYVSTKNIEEPISVDVNEFINSKKMEENVINYNDNIVKMFLKENMESFCVSRGCLFTINCNKEICKNKFSSLGYEIENETEKGFYVKLPNKKKMVDEESEPEESFEMVKC